MPSPLFGHANIYFKSNSQSKHFKEPLKNSLWVSECHKQTCIVKSIKQTKADVTTAPTG